MNVRNTFPKYIQESLSNKATLFAKKLWPYQRGDLWWEGEVNTYTFTVVAPKIYGLIREGGLRWEWPLREGPLYQITKLYLLIFLKNAVTHGQD